MPKRNRHRELKRSGVIQPAAPTPVERDVQLFAQRVKADEQAALDEKRRAREAMEYANRHDALKAAKEQAVVDLKKVRGSGAGSQRVAEAEAAYRTALADLQEFETGARPTWARTVPATNGDASADSDPQEEPESEEESAS
jgi:hypothetical protein